MKAREPPQDAAVGRGGPPWRRALALLERGEREAAATLPEDSLWLRLVTAALFQAAFRFTGREDMGRRARALARGVADRVDVPHMAIAARGVLASIHLLHEKLHTLCHVRRHTLELRLNWAGIGMAATNESAEVSPTERVSNKSGLRRAIAVVLPAWVLTLGVDLFLHAGLMAEFYNRQIPFLVSPEIALRRIPAGYVSFLLLIVALYWLLKRMDIRGSVAGFRWGIVAGLTLGGATLLGLWSIATAPMDLLVSWWIGQGLELGIAGAVLGAARRGTSLLRLWGLAGISIVILIGLTIALQTAGFGGS